MTTRVAFSRRLLHPRYWVTWIGLAIFWLLVKLPYPVQMWFGKFLGRVLMGVAIARRRIIETNLRLCFPQWPEYHRHDVLVKNMESMGMAAFEIGIAWWWPKQRLAKIAMVEGVEHLQNLEGGGALLLAMHFTTLEIGASLLSTIWSIDGIYRPHQNPVFDYIQRRGRERHHPNSVAMPRNEVRLLIRSLRNGRLIWFMSDQDYGCKQSVFVPFFGVPAATITSVPRLAKLGNARVIPFTQTRSPDGIGYKLTIHPAIKEIPSGNEVEDVMRLNAFFEEQILKQPEQYLWAHRRFKTCPAGVNFPYEKRIKQFRRR